MLLAAIAAGALAWRGRTVPEAGPVGLFTTLPILWSEAPDVAGMLKAEQPPHWARAVLAGKGRIVALDMLSAPGEKGPLRSLRRLVIAQPRPLSPDENVALDVWVREGGRVLLFADPALTEESDFAIGDPRRPQAVVLLSPILRRWGLDLQFDEGQRFGAHAVAVDRVAVPVNLPGRFALLPGASCTLAGEGLVASCRIGRGQVTAVADAEVLARTDPDGAHAAALGALRDRAFAAP